MSVKTRAKKILGPMLNYRPIENFPLPNSLSDIQLLEGEECVGIYENEKDNYVLVTDQGIHIVIGKNDSFVAYKDIQEAELPDVNKLDADFIDVKLLSGRSVLIPIRHGKGKFKDVYEFARFIDRVTA